MVPVVDCRELFLRLGDDEVLVVDCRSYEDWERFELHIPGALWMPLSELDGDAHTLPDDELIVLCGSAADGSDTWRAYRLLQMRGREAVVCLEGGLQAWVTSGYPTERHGSRAESYDPHYGG
jgi:rhodanese-related sulfurtransferase